MNVLIIEDEKPAATMLEMLLLQYDPSITIINWITSIKKSVEWLKVNLDQVDLIFMDIQLTDGLCFEIFKKVSILKPVIFTTAYDQYAIEAFKVNSIDYLLKPVKPEDLARSMNKYKSLKAESQNPVPVNFENIVSLLMQKHTNYSTRILIKVGDHIRSVKIDDACVFYAEGRTVYVVTSEKKKYIVDYTLEDLCNMLDPKVFFRCNRTFIVNINAITDVVVYSNTRLKIRIPFELDEDIIVSRERVPQFKACFGGQEYKEE